MSVKKCKSDNEIAKTQLGLITSCFLGAVTIATALLHYLDQQLAMGILEFYGYSFQNVARNPVDILGVIFESAKCLIFILIVHIVFYMLIVISKRINYQELAKELFLIYAKSSLVCADIFNALRKWAIKDKHLENPLHNTKMSGRIEPDDAKERLWVLFLKIVYIYILITVAWISLQYTKNAIDVCISRSYRLYGYTEGTSHYIPSHNEYFSNPSLLLPIFNMARIGKYSVYSIPYIPACLYVLIKRLFRAKKQVFKVLIIFILIAVIPFVYSILLKDISSTVYFIGQNRVKHNIYHDVVYINDAMYAVALETEDKLYITRCKYSESGEVLIIYADERMCIDKEGILIEKWIAYGGAKSNFEDIIQPLYEWEE